MSMYIDDNDAPFWSALFATKAFRRVPNFIIWNNNRRAYPEVYDGALFDFITDCSLMPAGKPRVVSIEPLSDESLFPLLHRLDKNVASIVGQVCAIITDIENYDDHYLTNMAIGRSRQGTLAEQLLRNA